MKICTKCRISKPITEFYKRNNRSLNSTISHCKLCVYKKTTLNRQKESSSIEGHIKALLRSKKTRDDISLLSKADVIQLYYLQNGKCAITKEPLTYIQGKGKIYTNLSIDRIDSSKGYTIDNIQLVCFIVNMMKKNYTMDSFIYWCNKVTYGEINDRHYRKEKHIDIS